MTPSTPLSSLPTPPPSPPTNQKLTSKQVLIVSITVGENGRRAGHWAGGEVTLWTRGGHRVDIGWTQDGHRVDTGWSQDRHRVDIGWTQGGHRVDTGGGHRVDTG